ncbi:hypothetical protein PWT90_02190 [Aphanocladium album]|nr:hypothetical protein PWT90_02190 [Aphanocladium album]
MSAVVELEAAIRGLMLRAGPGERAYLRDALLEMQPCMGIEELPCAIQGNDSPAPVGMPRRIGASSGGRRGIALAVCLRSMDWSCSASPALERVRALAVDLDQSDSRASRPRAQAGQNGSVSSGRRTVRGRRCTEKGNAVIEKIKKSKRDDNILLQHLGMK